MGRVNGLLNKTLLYYTFLATFVLLLSAPFFYLVMEKLYTDDVDEAIYLRKKEFEIDHLKTIRSSDIHIWNRFNRDVRIIPDTISGNRKNKIIQETIFDEVVPEWEPYRVLYSDVKIEGKPYVLKIQLNLVESEDFIKAIIYVYLVILGGMLLVIFFITRFIANRLWKPFYETLQLIDKFNIEQQSLPSFNKTGTKEFDQLNTGIEKMIVSNVKSYNSQKSFTQNASHELQTPLAIFQSKLDLLLQDTSLTQQQSVVLQSLYEASLRLSRINKNLLLLTKIENRQYAEVSTFTVNELVNDVIGYFEEQAENKNLRIEIEENAIIEINANRVLTEILINNLILNAIRHNLENGNITILIEDAKFSIINTGIYKELDNAILFKRFGKATTDTRSSGLGLAIVKEIVEQYKWDIKYEFKNNLHCFTVLF